MMLALREDIADKFVDLAVTAKLERAEQLCSVVPYGLA